MSDEEFVVPPTTPELKTDSGIIWTPKQFSDNATLDFTDEEIKRMMEVIVQAINKHQPRWRERIMHDTSLTVEGLSDMMDQFRDEVVTKLGEELQIAANVDAAPCLEGQPPIVEIIGHLPGSTMDKYGFDHEQKGWEVTRAAGRGEDYLGQKGKDKYKGV